MIEIAPTRETQLELFDSVANPTTESTSDDSVENFQLSDHQYKILISYLTRRSKAEKKSYGSGWISISKSAGTARTDNQYIQYQYKVHWRKNPFKKYIGNVKNKKVLKIAQAVRQAIDSSKPPHEIEKLIEKMKQEK